MIKTIYTLGVLVLAMAGTVFVLSVPVWSQQDRKAGDVLAYPSAIQRFRDENDAGSAIAQGESSPLIEQSRILAAYLDPVPPARDDAAPVAHIGVPETSPTAPSVRPAAPSVRFKLCGTSYYPNEPGRSMALISEVGSPEGDERWVKEGTQVGHFVIHEIRRGMIVYRDGEQLREMAVEHGASVPSLVRDNRPGSLQVSSAADNPAAVVSSPAGPNDAGPIGGN